MYRLRFSVALATFNGGNFLSGQLQSYLTQTLLPAELVVCDDGSTDRTLDKLHFFAQVAPFEVRVVPNDFRLGLVQNFAKAISLCRGDLIALSDQDDVWRPDKLTRLAQALNTPGAIAAFSDAEVTAADLGPLGYTMWQRVRFTRREQAQIARRDGFAVLLKHRVVTGATLAFKASLREAALPIPAGWDHDAWLALIAAAQQQLIAVPETLIAYRQHDGNVVGGARTPFQRVARKALGIDRAAWYREELGLWRTLDERLDALSAPCEARAALKEKLAHLETRARLPAARWQRLPGVLRELVTGRYARYARNWGSLAIDLLVR